MKIQRLSHVMLQTSLRVFTCCKTLNWSSRCPCFVYRIQQSINFCYAKFFTFRQYGLAVKFTVDSCTLILRLFLKYDWLGSRFCTCHWATELGNLPVSIYNWRKNKGPIHPKCVHLHRLAGPDIILGRAGYYAVRPGRILYSAGPDIMQSGWVGYYT